MTYLITSFSGLRPTLSMVIVNSESITASSGGGRSQFFLPSFLPSVGKSVRCVSQDLTRPVFLCNYIYQVLPVPYKVPFLSLSGLVWVGYFLIFYRSSRGVSFFVSSPLVLVLVLVPQPFALMFTDSLLLQQHPEMSSLPKTTATTRRRQRIVEKKN